MVWPRSRIRLLPSNSAVGSSFALSGNRQIFSFSRNAVGIYLACSARQPAAILPGAAEHVSPPCLRIHLVRYVAVAIVPTDARWAGSREFHDPIPAFDYRCTSSCHVCICPGAAAASHGARWHLRPACVSELVWRLSGVQRRSRQRDRKKHTSELQSRQYLVC